VLCWDRRAGAEDSDASRLFDEGRTLVIAGRFAEACPKLEQSQRLEPRLGTQLNVAFCQERLGKVATAWLGFQQALSTARRGGDVARETFAQGRIDALEPRVPWLRVRAGAAADQLTVQLDGVPLAPSRWGQELPLDPGEHALLAARGGDEYWRATVVLAESQHVDISVPPPPATRRDDAAEHPTTRAAETSAAGHFVFEVGAFVGIILVDTNRSELDADPASIETTVVDADGMTQRLSCATATCDYASLGASSGVVAGVSGYVGYTVAPPTSLGLRFLVGPRVEGGGLLAAGPSASFALGRLRLGPTILFGTASHADWESIVLEWPAGSSYVEAPLRASLGFAIGLSAELGLELVSTSTGSVVLQATPLFLYGPNGMAYSLPLGVAYRWD